MKKTILISGAVIFALILVVVGWYLFLRNPNIPLGETISDLLPFGSGDNLPSPPNDSENLPGSDDELLPDEFGSSKELFLRLSETPVAGFTLLNKSASGSTGSLQATIARYVDRATGHIYDVDLTTLKKNKVTNLTLPKVYEAYFRTDGKAVLFRSLRNDSDLVENISLALTPPKVTATSSLASDTLYTATTTIVRGDIGAVIAGSGDILFYTLRDANSIVSSTFNGSGVKTILGLPFTQWRLVVSDKNLVAYTKTSAGVPGFAYTLNTSGALAKILGPLNGLIVLPNAQGSRVLYSYVDGGQTRLFVKNISSGDVLKLSASTLAEKCVWSKKKPAVVFCGTPSNDIGVNEPDNWYKGMTNFYDRIWSFDTDAELAQVLVEPINVLGFDLDVIEPRLSPDEDYLVFINKIDLSLWALKLEEF